MNETKDVLIVYLKPKSRYTTYGTKNKNKTGLSLNQWLPCPRAVFR